jgi:hypothetical protein
MVTKKTKTNEYLTTYYDKANSHTYRERVKAPTAKAAKDELKWRHSSSQFKTPGIKKITVKKWK